MADMFSPFDQDDQGSANDCAEAAHIPVATPIVPAPDTAPPLNFRHVKLGSPHFAWRYESKCGELMFYICRWDLNRQGHPPKKLILPVSYCALGNGQHGWCARRMSPPLPLYNLPEIVGRRDAAVIICEGEKAAGAAANLFPQWVATTTANGANSPHLTDFSALSGRTVILSADCDRPGHEYGDAVHRLVMQAGAAAVLRMSAQRMHGWIWHNEEGSPQIGPPSLGWDLADAIEQGWTPELAATLQDEPDFLIPSSPSGAQLAKPRHDSHSLDSQSLFRITSRGVEKRVNREDKEGNTSVYWTFVCSPLEVLAESRSEMGDQWGRLLGIKDRDGRVKQWAMPMAMLAGDGAAYREKLLSLGLVIAPGRFARAALHEYISSAPVVKKVLCVSRTGWHGTDAFALGNDSIGPPGGQQLVMQCTGTSENPYRTGGTLRSWQKNVARFAVGNSRLLLAISSAFAAPLLFLTGTGGGGIELIGDSSTGKTTALTVAGSVCGGGGTRGYVKSWRATGNGLETVAALHCDTLLCLDETGEVDGREAAGIVYMLANGSGKARAGKTGEGRPIAEWRLLFLSTGELSLAQKSADDRNGRRVAAGQYVRMLDIPACAGCEMGLFENLHGFESPDAFAKHLVEMCGGHYGHGLRRFIQVLVEKPNEIKPLVQAFLKEFVTQSCPTRGTDGQVRRAATRFGLIAAGGELAVAAGILPWEPGEATAAAQRCLGDWLNRRGGYGPAEEREDIASIRHFLELHGTSRFEGVGQLAPKDLAGRPIEQRTYNKAGYRQKDPGGGIRYVVTPEAWRTELCQGRNPQNTAMTLRKLGYLVIDGEGKHLVKFRVPGAAETVRCYMIKEEIMGAPVLGSIETSLGEASKPDLRKLTEIVREYATYNRE